MSRKTSPSTPKTKPAGATSSGRSVLSSVKTKPQVVYVPIGGKIYVQGQLSKQGKADLPKIAVVRKPAKTKLLKSSDATRKEARAFLKRAGILDDNGRLRDVLLSK